MGSSVDVLPFEESSYVKTVVGKKIEEALRSGRRYFGSSGASLTHQAFNPKYKNMDSIDSSSAKIGLEGERSTTQILKKWLEDKPNAVLIDSVHIRGWGKEEVDPETGMIDGGDTDHIVVIGNEVLLIDTKKWKTKTSYSISDEGVILRSNKTFPGGRVQANASLHLWMKFLQHIPNTQYTPIVMINADDITVFRTKSWYQQKYRLLEKSRFEEFLDIKWDKISDNDKSIINSTLVAHIAVGCVKPYDQRTNVFDMEKIREFSKNIS